jgi:hypothetical protein
MSRFSFNGIDLGEVESFSDLDDKFVRKIKSNLTTPQMLCLKMLGSFMIGHIKMAGWSMELPFYIYYCEKHSFQITYPTGHLKKLQCPECVKESASMSEAKPLVTAN